MILAIIIIIMLEFFAIQILAFLLFVSRRNNKKLSKIILTNKYEGYESAGL